MQENFFLLFLYLCIPSLHQLETKDDISCSRLAALLCACWRPRLPGVSLRCSVFFPVAFSLEHACVANGSVHHATEQSIQILALLQVVMDQIDLLRGCRQGTHQEVIGNIV